MSGRAGEWFLGEVPRPHGGFRITEEDILLAVKADQRDAQIKSYIHANTLGFKTTRKTKNEYLKESRLQRLMDHNKDDEEVQGCVNQPKVGSASDIIISQKNINDINTEACNSDNRKNIPKEHLQFPDGQMSNAANTNRYDVIDLLILIRDWFTYWNIWIL